MNNELKKKAPAPSAADNEANRSRRAMGGVGAGAAKAQQMRGGRGPGGPGGPGRRGPGGPRGPRAKLKDPKKTFVRLCKDIIFPYWPMWILIMLCTALSAFASSKSALFLGDLIDDYILPLMKDANPVFTGIAKAIGNMAIVYLIGIIATYSQSLIMVSVSQGCMRNMRNRMFSHMQSLPIKYFDANTFGDIMSHYTNDVETLNMLISNSLPNLISSFMTIVIVFASMVSLSIWLTLLALVFVFGMMFITSRLGGRSAGYFTMQQRALGSVNGFIEEIVTGQKVVKVFCHEDTCCEEFDIRNEELCDSAMRANSISNMMGPIMGNLGHLQYVVIAIVGGALAIAGVGGLTLGSIVAFLQLSRNFGMPVQQISMQINSIVQALAGAERIFRLLDEEPEKDEGYVTLVNAKYDENGELTESDTRTGLWAWRHPHHDGTLTYKKVEGKVTFTDVDFSYVPEKQILYDITLYAKPGQKVAFVGATGAGKTTITNLINRFYDIEDGKIRYDDININKIRKPDLRRSLGIVLQDVNLFTGTVRDNIRYGKLDATDDEVIRAAKLANAHNFITMLPNGYDTMLEGDGSGLSQGQRQLLSIARAAVADPPVMILDEATSSIDTRTELLVQKGMDGLMEGRTVFVIAHRLSTVQNSNVIMVLELGHIIERGTHEQLIEQGGTYYQLYTGTLKQSE